MSKEKISNLVVVEVPIGDLKAAEYNPRHLTAKQYKDLKKSIEEFGLVDPIIVNRYKGRENIVIGGHQRLVIAKELGYKTVPVVYLDLPEKAEKRLNLRLNRNLGEWDWDILANNFDVEELLEVGFEEKELDFDLFYSGDEKDNDVPDLPDEPVSQPGDMYQLGPHRVMCGDSTSPADVDRLMGGG